MVFFLLGVVFTVFLIKTPVTAKESQGNWLSQNGKVYYLVDGKKAKGLVTIGSRLYYFNPSTGEREKGWKRIRGQQYYFGTKGFALKGMQKIGRYRYYFNGKGILQKNNLVRP